MSHFLKETVKVGTFGLVDPFAGSAAPPPPPSPPTQDVAANAAKQQLDFLRRRRGVLGNIFAGAGQTAPATTTKATLGN